MGWETKDVVTAIAAGVGVVLGVMNMWRSILDDSVKVRVAFAKSPKTRSSVIVVTNLSSFPVTIVDVGAIRESGEIESIYRGELTHSNGSLPARIETRDSIEFPLTLRGFLRKHLQDVVGVYVRTACGKEIRSTLGVTLDEKITRYFQRTNTSKK